MEALRLWLIRVLSPYYDPFKPIMHLFIAQRNTCKRIVGKGIEIYNTMKVFCAKTMVVDGQCSVGSTTLIFEASN